MRNKLIIGGICIATLISGFSLNQNLNSRKALDIEVEKCIYNLGEPFGQISYDNRKEFVEYLLDRNFELKDSDSISLTTQIRNPNHIYLGISGDSNNVYKINSRKLIDYNNSYNNLKM